MSRSYIFDRGVVWNTVLISARFFVPLWFIALAFVLPCALLYDAALWTAALWTAGGFEAVVDRTVADIITLRAPLGVYLVLLTKAVLWISTYFASFVIVGEVSDICLGGTASFSKAMYKTSIRGVGRLLGTDILYLFVLLLALTPAILLSHFVIEPLVGTNSVVDVASVVALIVLSWSLPCWLFLFTAQVVAIERRYWFSALTRSVSLVWRSKKRSLAMFALFACTVLFWQLGGWLLVVLGERTNVSIEVVNVIGSVVLWAPYVPIPNILLTLAYYNLRRTQGELSAELLADIKAYEMS